MDNSYKNIDDAFQSFVRTESFISENVPALFSKDYQLSFRKKLIKYSLGYYNQSKTVTGTPKREYRAGLRQKIIETGKKFNVNEFGSRIKLTYSMVCKCPLILDLFYPGYTFLSRVFRKRKA